MKIVPFSSVQGNYKWLPQYFFSPHFVLLSKYFMKKKMKKKNLYTFVRRRGKVKKLTKL